MAIQDFEVLLFVKPLMFARVQDREDTKLLEQILIYKLRHRCSLVLKKNSPFADFAKTFSMQDI